MLIDTDILIDYLRSKEAAVAFLEAQINHCFVSAMTVAELYQGVREGYERKTLAESVSALSVLPVTEDIAVTAGLLRCDYKNTSGCGLADCIIAATAMSHRLQLVTLNRRHFPMLEDVLTPYEKS